MSKKCTCGAELELFESNFGGHEGEYCIVCPNRHDKLQLHRESDWFEIKDCEAGR